MTFRRALTRRLVALVAVLALVLTGCTDAPVGRQRRPDANAAVAALVTGIPAGDLSGVVMNGDATRPAVDLEQIFAAMKDFRPQITAGEITYGADVATVPLTHTYDFGQAGWELTTKAEFSWVDEQWKLNWTPTIVHPELGYDTRLIHSRQSAPRGNIIGANNVPIVWDRPIYRVGIDKSHVELDVALTSAAALAVALGIDIDPYVEQVRNAGPLAFVVGLTVREGRVPEAVDTIPGARAIEGTLPLADSPTFTNGLIGIVAPATAEDVERGKGAIDANDLVGQSGLQRGFDEQLRGLPGHTITLAPRSEEQLASAPPAPSASTPTSTEPPPRKVLYKVDPVPGEPLVITLDVDAQRRAEGLLADQPGVASLVVLDTWTGAILVSANSPSVGANSYATTGRYAPGSTFKITSSLALLRRGFVPDSPIECPATTIIEHTRFKNHEMYPAAFTGRIALRSAVAHSCNTAFINEAANFAPDEQPNAAASLGLGIDYDTGFPAFYGSVPASEQAVMRGANAIGQGEILASPMAMAGEAASVRAGKTIVPYIVANNAPEPKGAPLTAGEAAALQDLMGAVVASGTAMEMRGLLDGAKTGTAEFGADGRSHAWMIGYNDRYAIAAFIEDAPTAAPLAKALLS